jgi:hypothetical protein
MFLKPNWRILTIGDGDLSFSASLWQQFKPRQLTATVFDSQQALKDKYLYNAIELLKEKPEQNLLFNFDVTEPSSWPNDWIKEKNAQFDLVIFQFPLMPSFSDPERFQRMDNISINTLNRLLLRQFLIHCEQYFLDPKGAQLCYITSKDVKPYCEWNIDNCLNQGLTTIKYLGSMPFHINNFPGYRVRNVDRDGYVKDTKSTTYVWSTKQNLVNCELELSELLQGKSHQQPNACSFCKAGPFISRNDQSLHEQTKKHRLMQKYEKQYANAINKVRN